MYFYFSEILFFYFTGVCTTWSLSATGSTSHDSFSTIRYIPELLEPPSRLHVIPEVTLPHFVKTHKDSLVLVACSQKFICVTLVGHFDSLRQAWRLHSGESESPCFVDDFHLRIRPGLASWTTSSRPGSMTTFLTIYSARSDSPFIVYRQLKGHWNLL